MIKSDEEIANSIEEVLEKLRNDELTASEAISMILLEANTLPTNIGDVALFYEETNQENAASIARSITNITDKGFNPEEVSKLINTISYTQIQPENDKYLDTPSQTTQAIDIGRKILKREKKGGRPSKVEATMKQLKKYIKWHNGQQQSDFITRELKRAKQSMSRPTWNKLTKKANELLDEKLSTTVDYYLDNKTQ